MKLNTLTRYLKNGLAFFRDHPQLWLTALVGLSIVLSFLFIAWQFARIAQNAQEDLVNVRAGTILDPFVILAPRVLYDPDVLRNTMMAIREENPTLESFTVYAQHGNNAWRVYVSDGGPHEGAVTEETLPVFSLAQADPAHSYTIEQVIGGERRFITARAIVDTARAPVALAVVSQGMAESDTQITESIQESTFLLFAVLFVITVLFFRHARIVDFAILYKKQLEIDEMKANFISMASHELKSPLSVIRGYIEFLKEAGGDTEKKNEYLRRIDISAKELSHLIEDILDVSRIEMGRLRFSVEYVRPAEVLHEVFDMFAAQAEKKDLKLLLDVPENEVNALTRVDRGRLKQVMVNLVSNAVKYTFSGDVVLGLKTAKKHVEISVKDSGIGMTAQEQKKLFTKFYRVPSEEGKHVSGTGLGLWITNYIVEHMNGVISVESIKGEGSRFVVRFPRYLK